MFSKLCALVVVACGVLGLVSGTAQSQARDGRIYTCTDAQGRRLSSDRPIPECLAREQLLLNRDGSRRSVVPPTLTAEEQHRHDQAQQQVDAQRAEREEARRRDRALLLRYPDRPAYDAARMRALAPVQQLIDITLNRLTQLEADTTKLSSTSGLAPEALRQRKLMNEGAIETQRGILRSHLDEQARLTLQMDQERERLEHLWAGLAAVSAGQRPVEPTVSSGVNRANSR